MALVVMMAFVLLLSTLVLIGVELLESIVKTYLEESSDHARIVIAVAIIAISRKVIILDVKDLSGTALLGIAAIILALTIGYYLVRKNDTKVPTPSKEQAGSEPNESQSTTGQIID